MSARRPEPAIDAIFASAEILTTASALHSATARAAELAIKSRNATVIRLVNETLEMMTRDLEKLDALPGPPPAEVGES